MSDESDKQPSTQPTDARNVALVRRLARAVREASERPSDIAAIREAAKELATSAAKGATRLTVVDGAVLVDDASLEGQDDDARLLAARFVAYGVEELGIMPLAAPADLTDLVRLLAAAPAGDDPAARFAAGAAVIDARTVSRRLRQRVRLTPADVLPVAPSAPPRRSTKATPTIATGPVRGVPEPPKEEETDLAREALALPATTDERLSSIFTALSSATETASLRGALDEIVNFADLAFRKGQDSALLESLTGLISIEHAQLERDSSDERRQGFTHAVRQLARPVMLRHLAVLRHRLAADAESTARLQAVLRRFGTDAVDALVDEYAAAPTLAARARCLDALRGLRRTHDALHLLVRGTDEVLASQAAAILGGLDGPRSLELLTDLLQHPHARARRAAVAAFSRAGFAAAHDALRIALGDESPMVRARAVAALATMKEHASAAINLLSPLLDREDDSEVLYAAVAALGALGGPEAVQLLVKVAEGAGDHPRRRTAALRIQGCTALVAIRTPTAMACVQGLTGDRDREVRDAAVRLVAQASRRTTQSQPILSAP